MANTGPDDPTCSTTCRCSCSSPGRSTGSDSGGTTSPTAPLLNQTRLLTFPGSIAHQRRRQQRLLQQAHDNLPPPRKPRQDAPAGKGQRLSAARLREQLDQVDGDVSGGPLGT